MEPYTGEEKISNHRRSRIYNFSSSFYLFPPPIFYKFNVANGKEERYGHYSNTRADV